MNELGNRSVKFPFILDRNLAKASCTENRVCTSCDIVVLEAGLLDVGGSSYDTILNSYSLNIV